MSLQTNLSAFWELENTSWTDALGVNDLTGTNSPTAVAAVVGNGVKFTNGSGMLLSHASATELILGGGNYSFSLWVNLASGIALSAGSIMSKNTGGFANTEYQVGTRFTSGHFWMWGQTNTNTDNDFCTSSVAVSSGAHHIVGTWDGTTQRIYVDAGTADTNVPPFGPATSSTSTFMIGKDGGGGGTLASVAQDVTVDQVGLWKGRVLTSDEVSQLYNGGSGLTYAAMAGAAAILYAAFSIPQLDGRTFTQMIGY